MLFEATVKELGEQIKGQARRVEELERRLNQNSQNSHGPSEGHFRPPSSDGPSKGHFGFKRPPPRSQRQKTGRRWPLERPLSGGQEGHDGSRLEMVEVDKVNKFVEYWPETCSGCGTPQPVRAARAFGERRTARGHRT